MRFQITHTTAYKYAADVGRCYNLAYIAPRSTLRQNCVRSQVQVTPAPAQQNKRLDYFGNSVFSFSIQKRHTELSITAESEVAMLSSSDLPELDLGLTCHQAQEALAGRGSPEIILAREHLLDSPMVRTAPDYRAYAEASFQPDRPLLAAARDLTERIYHDFTYDPGFTTVATPLQEVLQHKRGVCQDFAHLAIACLRAMGYPARYVSGYLETLPPPGQVKLVGADATHAWFAVYSPGEGWFEFDPTNNKMAGEQHIVTAWGRDYSDVAPLRGVIFGGGKSPSLSVAVTVERLPEPEPLLV